jgi:hypothetical protein
LVDSKLPEHASDQKKRLLCSGLQSGVSNIAYAQSPTGTRLHEPDSFDARGVMSAAFRRLSSDYNAVARYYG